MTTNTSNLKTPAGQKLGEGQGSGVTPTQKPVIIKAGYNAISKGMIRVVNGYPIKEELKKRGFKFNYLAGRPSESYWGKDGINTWEEVFALVLEIINVVRATKQPFKLDLSLVEKPLVLSVQDKLRELGLQQAEGFHGEKSIHIWYG